ncbi:sulfate transporter [Pasteurellaceae bacterium Orientalotternb1]|nr:sulfate transporter [Pasteurellaceae bacterium Orientalotternb1]
MSKQVIDGKTYWQDAQGRLIAEELVKEMDKERDALVTNFVKQAKDVQIALRDFKNVVFADVGAFVQLSAEKYDVKIGGRKGNLTLYSFDGKYKLQVAVSNHIRFDERIQAGKVLIDECLHEWAGEARPELKALIDNAFQVDKEGNLSTARILSLRRVDIQDERWTRAMQAISDSVQIVGSKDYVRFYECDAQGKYQPISLDIAGV